MVSPRALGGVRTHTVQILSLLPLPIGLLGHLPLHVASTMDCAGAVATQFDLILHWLAAGVDRCYVVLFFAAHTTHRRVGVPFRQQIIHHASFRKDKSPLWGLSGRELDWFCSSVDGITTTT